jgi:hypothetical protein
MQVTPMKSLDQIRESLLNHPIYREINTPEKVEIFMEHHVFAVWDFMSLLKRLQQDLTTVQVPWIPSPNSEYTRFINEIVLAEESDEDGLGGHASHFELYLEAMKQSQVETDTILMFVAKIKSGVTVEDALKDQRIPRQIAEFVQFTLHVAQHGKTHEVAAAFFYGREDVIPDMFSSLIESLRDKGMNCDRLIYYLERHIELDGDHHGPLAQKLLTALCEGDATKEREAEEMAIYSLQARKNLWDGVLADIRFSSF